MRYLWFQLCKNEQAASRIIVSWKRVRLVTRDSLKNRNIQSQSQHQEILLSQKLKENNPKSYYEATFIIATLPNILTSTPNATRTNGPTTGLRKHEHPHCSPHNPLPPRCGDQLRNLQHPNDPPTARSLIQIQLHLPRRTIPRSTRPGGPPCVRKLWALPPVDKITS